MANSNLFASPPIQTPYLDEGGNITLPWIQWFQAVGIELSMPLNGPVPATSTSKGQFGQSATDGNFLYVAVGTNQWKRTPLTSF